MIIRKHRGRLFSTLPGLGGTRLGARGAGAVSLSRCAGRRNIGRRKEGPRLKKGKEIGSTGMSRRQGNYFKSSRQEKGRYMGEQEEKKRQAGEKVLINR